MGSTMKVDLGMPPEVGVGQEPRQGGLLSVTPLL